MTRLSRLLALGLALLLPALASAQGIRDTKHDLSTSSIDTTADRVKATVANEICVFCHAPHSAQSTQLVWNHTLSTITSVSWGDDLDGNPLSATTEGTTLPGTLKGSSRRCLSCHDGSVAIGDVSNPPGNTTGPIDVDGPLGALDGDDSFADGYYAQVATNTAGAVDMAGNHPISIPYAGESAYNGIDSSATADGTPGNYYQTTTVGCVSPSGVCTTAPTTDSRDGAAVNLIPNVSGTTTNVGIECGSCHEPHNRYNYAPFLRVTSDASGLCRSCHNK